MLLSILKSNGKCLFKIRFGKKNLFWVYKLKGKGIILEFLKCLKTACEMNILLLKYKMLIVALKKKLK